MAVPPLSTRKLQTPAARPRLPRPPQEELLKKAAVAARGERERREAAASMAERVEMNARTNEKRKELRKAEVRSSRCVVLCLFCVCWCAYARAFVRFVCICVCA